MTSFAASPGSRVFWIEYDFADCAHFLKTDPRIEFQEPYKQGYYLAFEIKKDALGVFEDLTSNYHSALPESLAVRADGPV